MRKTKEEYHQLTNLYIKQKWLIAKKEELKELIDFCEDAESKGLVFSLLERFAYLDNETLNFLLNELSDYIINETGFTESTTQLLSLTYDDEADSSQKILDNIKHPIYKKGWRQIKTVNMFGKSISNYNKGKREIIIVDEFIGSGRTLRGRIDYLKKNIPGEFKLKCCFIAGIKNAIDNLTAEGIEIFCPLQLDKGISEYFEGDKLIEAEDLMLKLELKLAQYINGKDLFKYSFGYGSAEALYTMEGCNGNTPNSVFPIFWWLKDKLNIERNTVLTRFEIGF
ncbi:phosphoribosyltransferase-like protein [Chryseobacterium vrystaatense]|uniref:PRTase-CE domain-containing protein n=1 Tax=Chryseobacterium vrystaatense TaxID=307480 RepID=A0ABR4UQR5_9FLAO|nr:hypothetical protein [Chryseobacterium vrystaatense]KFF27398.1 hypothetical protein IW16_09245 [Chryseobacterium vrystaatense]